MTAQFSVNEVFLSPELIVTMSRDEAWVLFDHTTLHNAALVKEMNVSHIPGARTLERANRKSPPTHTMDAFRHDASVGEHVNITTAYSSKDTHYGVRRLNSNALLMALRFPAFCLVAKMRPQAIARTRHATVSSLALSVR